MSTEPPARPLDLRWVVLFIAISAPIALGIETLVRTQVIARILGPSLNEVRGFFSPELTRLAWAMVVATVAAGIFGILVTLMAGRRIASEPDPAIRARKLRDRLLLLTSIPQIPAIAATFCFTAGARLFPVMVAMAVSTVFVLIQGFVGQKVSDPSGSPSAQRSRALAG